MLASIGIVNFLVFGYLALRERECLRLAWASRWWRVTDGKIIAIKDRSFIIDTVSRYAPPAAVKYSEDVLTVTYKVGHQIYTTTNYSFGGHGDQPSRLYQTGDHLPVYYDPADPARAVVRKGVPASLLVCPGLCVVGVLLVIVGLIW